MNTSSKVQKSVAGHTTGSFINYMMGNNSTLPEVGKGCTILGWSDRHAYEVMNVSVDGKKVTIQQMKTEWTKVNILWGTKQEYYDYSF